MEVVEHVEEVFLFIRERARGRTLVWKEVSIEWGCLRKQTELKASRNNKVTLLSSKSSSWKYYRQNNTKSECGLQGEIFEHIPKDWKLKKT